PYSAYATLASTVIAGVKPGDIQAHHCAANCVPEADVDLVFKIAAGLRLVVSRNSRASTREHVGKDVAEAAGAGLASTCKVRKIKPAEVKRNTLTTRRRPLSETASAEASTTGIGFGSSRINIVRIEAKLIIDLALLGIAQDIVGFRDFLEFFFGLFVVGVNIRMVLSGELTESFADLLLRGALLHAQSTVIIFLLGGRDKSS